MKNDLFYLTLRYELFATEGNNHVYIRQAGWPLPYIFDNPNVSVPDDLFIYEDDFNLGFFLLDVCFFASILNMII